MPDLNDLTELAMGNGRYKPKKRTATQHPPPYTLKGSVDFLLKASADGRTLTMEMAHAGGDDLRGVSAMTHEHYLCVPAGKVVQLTLNLTGSWDWKFPQDAFTLGIRDHAERYWLIDATDKSMTLIIEPSGVASGTAQQMGDAYDEKFNLTVRIAQDGTAIPLVITIDPITKNPPPVDGMVVPQGQSVPIY